MNCNKMNLIQLIESVKKHSNIYKNVHVDDEEYGKEWQRVAKELARVTKCEVTADEAQDLWNEILVEYMEYLRGNQEFALAKHMDFLQPYLFTILDDAAALDEEELSNILADDGRVSSVTETISSNKIDNDAEKCRNEKNTNATKTEKNNHDDAHVKQDIVPDTSVPILNTIRVPSPTPPAPQPKIKTTQNDSSFSNLSSMELIFLGYAKQLQKMPLTLQLQTKRKIADIMDEVELKMMEDSMKG